MRIKTDKIYCGDTLAGASNLAVDSVWIVA